MLGEHELDHRRASVSLPDGDGSMARVVAEGATSLRRGIAILEVLAAGEEPLGVVRIAELIGREKSQVSRTLATLAEHGYVERDPATRGYRLGPHVFGLAARAAPARLLGLAPPLLRRLVDELGETAHLSVLDGARVLTLASEAPRSAIRASGWGGRELDAACTSAGRALLLDHDRPRLDALFAGTTFPAAGPNAPRTVADLWRRLEATRRTGWALADEESEAGLVAAAAPVRDFRGAIVAAVNVSGPKFRLGARLEEAGALVTGVAAELSRCLGYSRSA
jgi:DNA-binding IclR family transcriptional regulator